MITKSQIQILEKIFSRNKLNGDLIANVFFNYLFSLRPILWLLLYKKIRVHRKRFAKLLHQTIHAPTQLGEGSPILEAIGCENALDGIRLEDYELAKTAFLFTLEQFLDDEFTPEVKATSAAVFETVTQKMARAANKLGDVLSLEDVSSFKREIVH